MRCEICDSTAKDHACDQCGERGFCRSCAAPENHYCRYAVVVPRKRTRGKAGKSITVGRGTPERPSLDTAEFLRRV